MPFSYSLEPLKSRCLLDEVGPGSQRLLHERVRIVQRRPAVISKVLHEDHVLVHLVHRELGHARALHVGVEVVLGRLVVRRRLARLGERALERVHDLLRREVLGGGQEPLAEERLLVVHHGLDVLARVGRVV